MLIHVVYSSGRYDMVKPALLDQLIAKQELSQFKRASGWVVVGRDPIRSPRETRYTGQDRRQQGR